MKLKFSMITGLFFAMLFATVLLPQTTSAGTAAGLKPMFQDNCVVVGDNALPLRVRATPGGRVIGSLKIGTQILAYSVVEDRYGNYWTKIKFKRGFGYVSTDYVSCG